MLGQRVFHEFRTTLKVKNLMVPETAGPVDHQNNNAALIMKVVVWLAPV
jgi:hypothetical protein